MYVSPTDIKTFQAIFLLDLLDRSPIKTIVNGDDRILEPLLIELMAKGYIQTSGLYYKATSAGKAVLDTFMKRYTEYLKLYDVFGFVDLDKAEFAFTKYFDFDTDEQWNNFKNQPRFEDLRITVALFKKLNPAEIVFMSFINEGRFDTANTGWQIDLLSDAAWNEIEEICKTALQPEQLGEAAMTDIIEQGCRIAVALIEEEAKRDAEEAKKQTQQMADNAHYVEETVIVEESYDPYYYSYYNAFYVSPIWFTPLFIW